MTSEEKRHAISVFNEAVARKQKLRNMSRIDAVAEVAKKRPAVHDAYLRATHKQYG